MGKYHDVLGVNEGATTRQINLAYRKMARVHHPDRGGDEAKMKEVTEAYDGLMAGKSGPKPEHLGPQFNTHFTPQEKEPDETRVGADDPMRSGSFDWRHAPDENLGGYSYAQHVRDTQGSPSEEFHEQRSAEIKANTEKALKGGWTPGRAAGFNCAYCGDSMEGTEPHEIFNKLNFSGKKVGSIETVVGMHDDCYNQGRHEGSLDHCEHCGLPVYGKEKEYGEHSDCMWEHEKKFWQ